LRTAWWCSVAVLAACSGSDPSASAVAHDPCAPLAIRAPDATADEQAGIEAALDLWRGRGVTAFTADAPADPSSTITIRFESAAETFHGLYEPDQADVLINRDLADATQRSIVIAHELGHVFGLVHIDPAVRLSLMNAGNLVTPPTAADQQALAVLWAACPALQ
jgi:hypothetical protein